jgi:hypothetical protein
MMEANISSETSVLTRATRRNFPESSILYVTVRFWGWWSNCALQKDYCEQYSLATSSSEVSSPTLTHRSRIRIPLGPRMYDVVYAPVPRRSTAIVRQMQIQRRGICYGLNCTLALVIHWRPDCSAPQPPNLEPLSLSLSPPTDYLRCHIFLYQAGLCGLQPQPLPNTEPLLPRFSF